MSILPNASTAAFTSASGASDLVRSPANTAVSPWISPAACSATSPSRSLIRTCAPCETSSSAVARPIPRAEPVTIADLPSSTPISCALLVVVGRAGYIGAAAWSPGVCGGQERAHPSAGHDHAEILCVDRAAATVGERGRWMRGDADAGFAVTAIEDVGAVSRRGHPRRDDLARSGKSARRPGDVLADFVADTRAGDVAHVTHPRGRCLPARADMFEVVAEGHAVGVRLRCA